MRRDSGITLIEVMVAVLVLSIGTVAAFRVMDATRSSIGSAPDRLFAQQVALNRVAAYQALGVEEARKLPDTADYADRQWAVTVAEAQTAAGYIELTVAARSPDGEGSLLVAFVRPYEADRQ